MSETIETGLILLIAFGILFLIEMMLIKLMKTYIELKDENKQKFIKAETELMKAKAEKIRDEIQRDAKRMQ